MKVALFEFQETALDELRAELLSMRAEAKRRPQALSFSAPTGAGKTIMMTALFEQILFGAPGFEPQADAAILWLSDMPELNEQTRRKIEATSDRIRVNRVRTIDSDFDAERLEGGYVYFVNTQKLGTDKLLTTPGNARQTTIWQTFANTARKAADRFYVVIDEAHRGARTASSSRQARTIMQRFVLGSPEVGMVACPMVIGVSATPQRFDDLLAGAAGRVTRRGVAITPQQVRSSGLLKDRVAIHHPESAAVAELSLLQDAARRWLDVEQRWAAYCEAEQEHRVYPVLVVQVADAVSNSPTGTDLLQAVTTIEGAIGRQMRERELAHTFNDVRDIALSGRRIRWVEASRIEEDHDIGVVFFKQNLSTGWDCPRAEVMMSFRRAQDDTYIAQLLGRMVRTPLARRIERDSALNDVHLLLPNFDTESVARVVKALQDPDLAPPASEVASARELVTLTRREGLDDVFAVLESLTTVRVNAARAQNPVRRLMKLGRALTYDELDLSAGGHARDLLLQALVRERDAMSTAGTLAAAVNAVLTVQVRTLTIDHFDGVATAGGSYAAATASGDLDALFEQAGRALSNGLHMEWWQADPDRDSQEAKAELVVLCRDGAVMQRLESKAQGELDRLFREWRGAIRGLPESRRQHYDQLRLADAKPVSMDWSLPQNIPFRRQPAAPAFDRHLFVEAGNVFRTELSGWEREVVAEMLSGDETVAWLRNLARQPWSLEVPYETSSGARPMFPDMVVIRRASAGYAVDVLEPHDPSLDDNVAKAHGLARFGQEHGAGFARIGLVRKLRVASGVEAYRLLDCCDAETARRVLLAATPAALDQLFTDRGVLL